MDASNGETPGGSVQIVALPSGSTLQVRATAGGEEIHLRSAGGAMELSIRITEDGPILSVRGVRLEIEAADRVAVTCREFAVHAREGVRLTSQGDVEIRSDAEIRARSGGATFIDADYVNLNCLDRTGYHDHRPDAVASDGAPGPNL